MILLRDYTPLLAFATLVKATQIQMILKCCTSIDILLANKRGVITPTKCQCLCLKNIANVTETL
jgi:hypothetical protein